MGNVLVMDCREYETFWLTLGSSHTIRFSSTAGEGLDILSERIGLVFLNLRLPDMSGLDALSMIKKAYPSVAVVIMASFGTEETCMEAFRRGARDYMRKPFNAEEIRKTMDMLMRARDASQRRRHVSLSTDAVRNERHPDVPSHFLNGMLKVREFVAENYFEPLSLDAACKMASVSKTYFCRFFKRITGLTLRNYHHAVRIRKAGELLHDKRLSVTDVAMRVGYDDPNYFSTLHKKITGLSPRQRQTSPGISKMDIWMNTDTNKRGGLWQCSRS